MLTILYNRCMDEYRDYQSKAECRKPRKKNLIEDTLDMMFPDGIDDGFTDVITDDWYTLNVGDSASSYRHWRNGAPCTRVKGEKMGGGEGACGSGAPFPPPIFSLFSPGGAHHSAANAVSERNLLRKITKMRQPLQRKRICGT